MYHLTDKQAADAHALAATVIAFAEERSRDFYVNELERESFVREFVVLCDTGFGVIVTGLPAAKALWLAIQKEFLRFNRQHLDLVGLRLEGYFDAMAKEPSNLVWNIAIAMTNFVGKNPQVVPWVSESFGEAIAIFLGLAEEVSEELDRLSARLRRSRYRPSIN